MFVPGTGVSVLRYKFQLWDYTERYLTSALSKVRANHVNAYSFVDHIDHFYSYTGKSASEYVDSDEFQTDLDYYDEVLGELIAPLVASGHVAWSTNDEIRNAFVEWENTNCPAQ